MKLMCSLCVCDSSIFRVDPSSFVAVDLIRGKALRGTDMLVKATLPEFTVYTLWLWLLVKRRQPDPHMAGLH